MVVLKEIEPVSFGKILAVLYAIGGLIEGIFATLIFSLISSAGSNPALAGATGTSSHVFAIFGLIGDASIIIFPIIGAIAGFIVGAIVALVYNFVASKIGGIELDLK